MNDYDEFEYRMDGYVKKRVAINEILEELKDRSLYEDPRTSLDFASGFDEGLRNAAVIVLHTDAENVVPIAWVEVWLKNNGYVHLLRLFRRIIEDLRKEHGES